MKKKLFALLLVLCLLLTACSAAPVQESVEPTAAPEETTAEETQPEETTAPEEDSVFIVGTTAEILTANRSEYNFDVISGTLSQLAPVWLDENGDYQPLLCDYSTEDSKTWALTVREGMTWHDGQPVTAEDIAFTLTFLDAQEGGGYADRYENIEVADERTINLTLPAANPRELANLTVLRILPKHIYDGVEDYASVPNEQANIGYGPYRYARFDADAGVIEFDAVENYPDGQPAFDQVLVQLFDSEDTLYMALKSGQVDMAYRYSGGVNPTVISDLSACDNLTLQPIRNTSNSAVLIFNNNKAPFDNENIRKAVACAIDYDAFRATFGSSYASASRAGFIPEGTPGYIETPELTRDLDKAKEYLTAAGCEDTDGDGFVEYNGEKLTFPVMLRGDKPAHERYAELLKNNLAQIGIELVPDIKEVATFRELTEQNQAQTAVITGLTAFGMAKNQGMASLYLWGENRMGYGQVYDEAYKALLDQADAAVTMEDYYAAAAAMQEYYAEHIPAVALYWDSHVQAYNSAYEGFVTDGTFGLLNVQTWMKLHKAA